MQVPVTLSVIKPGEPSSWSVSVTDTADYQLSTPGPLRITRVSMKKTATGTLICSRLPSGRSSSQVLGDLSLEAANEEGDYDTPFVLKPGDRLDLVAAGVTGAIELTVEYQNIKDPA